MDIKFFVSILLVLSLGAYFLPVENIKKSDEEKDIPQVIFENPLMYTLTENSLIRVVQASHAVKYKNREEMFDADIILKNTKDNNFKFEKLKADIIIKKKELYTLIDNVKYTRDDFVKLTTSEMFYNDEKNLAYNDKYFEGNYFNNKVNGTNLYLDVNEGFIKSKQTHFEIDMKNKGKK